MTLNVIGMRHGIAQYGQGHLQRIAVANDLTSEGILGIKSRAKEIAAQVKPDQDVLIWASPYGRTLQTARLTAEVLKSEGVQIKEKKNKNGDKWDRIIRIFSKLEEIRNLNLKYFNFCLNGGTLVYNGRKLVAGKEQVNPHSYSFPEYFNHRAWANIPSGILPDEFINEMNKIETEEEAAARFNHVISLIRRMVSRETNTRVLIVTHQALLSHLKPDAIINPGDVVEILI